MNSTIKKIISLILTICILSTLTVAVLADDDTTAPAASDAKTEPAAAEAAALISAQEVTLGQTYQLAAVLMTAYIDPSKVKGLENVKIDAENMDNLIIFAKAVGLIKSDDILQYKLRFKKDFDLEAPITRQEYAVILDRVFSILKVYGVEFSTPKAVSSSTSVAKGSSNGAGTSVNIGNGNNGASSTIDYYRDYKDLSGYAQKAFSNALAIGALKVKKYSETKTVKLTGNDTVIIEKGYFLAPNDIVTVGEVAESVAALEKLTLTEYSKQVLNAPLSTAAPATVKETTEEAQTTEKTETAEATETTETATESTTVSD